MLDKRILLLSGTRKPDTFARRMGHVPYICAPQEHAVSDTEFTKNITSLYNFHISLKSQCNYLSINPIVIDTSDVALLIFNIIL